MEKSSQDQPVLIVNPAASDADLDAEIGEIVATVEVKLIILSAAVDSESPPTANTLVSAIWDTQQRLELLRKCLTTLDEKRPRRMPH